MKDIIELSGLVRCVLFINQNVPISVIEKKYAFESQVNWGSEIARCRSQ